MTIGELVISLVGLTYIICGGLAIKSLVKTGIKEPTLFAFIYFFIGIGLIVAYLLVHLMMYIKSNWETMVW